MRRARWSFCIWAGGILAADGYVWLPKERVLCTGDAAVNGPRNKIVGCEYCEVAEGAGAGD